MLLAGLTATIEAVRATPSRTAKVAALAETLRALEPHEIEPAVAYLAGDVRQGRVGIGWATLSGIEVAPASTPTLTVADLDAAVDEVAALSGPGSTAARRDVLRALLARATEAEAGTIRRLLLGDLRQGALEGVMTTAVATAARVPVSSVQRAAMLAGDLPRVAALALTEGEVGLRAVRLQVLRPVLPMLASTAGDVAEAVAACGLSSVEAKLDGARVQAHRLGDDVRLYTRNLNDVTARLPAVVERVRDLPVRSVVLDGEVMGERHVWFFDCLHHDGDDLLDEPLTTRVGHLEAVAGASRVPSILTDDAAEARRFLADVLAAGHEGVVVKAATSTYEAGRRGKAWRKVKPVVTLDLVVLAAEWGYGRRTGLLSNIHLGARRADGGFVMVGKTFKGLTDELLAWQTQRFLELETTRHGIVVEVRPELVVEVAVDGVQSSSRYGGGVVLRFARVRRYREDKSPAEADSIETVRGVDPAAPPR